MRSAVFLSVKKLYLLYAFFLGLVIGTLFLNLMASDYFNQIGIFSEYFINKFNSLDINKSDLLAYTFLSRLKEMGLLIVFSFTVVSSLYNIGYCVFLGFSTGAFISGVTISSGIKGVWFYAVSIFPHYLIYVLLIMFTLNKTIQMNGQIYQKNASSERMKFLNVAAVIFVIILLCLLEAVLEVYINSPILEKVLKNY